MTLVQLMSDAKVLRTCFITAAISGVVTTAASGKPLPIPFAIVTV